MPLELEHRKVDVGGIGLHVVESGPADGPLVVLLHGFPEFWYGWRHQIGPLAAAGFRVLAPDQRGYNRSDKPRRVRDYALEKLAGDVVGLLDAAGRQRAFLVGHDWGGAVAWWTAVLRGERVERLAVLNCPHPSAMRRALLTSSVQRRKSWYMFFFQLPRLPERWYRKDDFAIGVRSVRGTARKGTFGDEEMARYKEAWARPGALRSMIHWYRAALRYPSRLAGRAPRVAAPTLVLWGERDRFLGRELAGASLDLCDDGRVEYLPEATHWLQHEEPERINRALVEFFG